MIDQEMKDFLTGKTTGVSFVPNALSWAIKELEFYNHIIEVETRANYTFVDILKDYEAYKKELLKIIAGEHCQKLIKDVLTEMQEQLDFPRDQLPSNPWMAIPSVSRHKQIMENFRKLSKGEV